MIQKKATFNLQIIVFIVSLFSFSFSLESKMFLGKIVFPKKVVPMLRLYYNGKSLTVDVKKGEECKTVPFSIDELPWIQDINILVCYNIACSSEDNNITNLRVPSAEPYKFYALEATRAYDANSKEVLSWNYVEQELEEGVIPDNTIIFIYDPALVVGLDIPVWNKSDQMRLLPGLIVDEKATAQELVRAMNVAYLSGMDIDVCHQKAETTSTKNNRIVATLPTSSGSLPG